jgi:hypothetical protein
MSMTDLVWISIGELLLAATFALGILVGVSMSRKGLRHDSDSDEGKTEGETGYDYWRDVERR